MRLSCPPLGAPSPADTCSPALGEREAELTVGSRPVHAPSRGDGSVPQGSDVPSYACVSASVMSVGGFVHTRVHLGAPTMCMPDAWFPCGMPVTRGSSVVPGFRAACPGICPVSMRVPTRVCQGLRGVQAPGRWPQWQRAVLHMPWGPGWGQLQQRGVGSPLRSCGRCPSTPGRARGWTGPGAGH